MKELANLLTALEKLLIVRRWFHPIKSERENARRRLLLSLDLQRMLRDAIRDYPDCESPDIEVHYPARTY